MFFRVCYGGPVRFIKRNIKSDVVNNARHPIRYTHDSECVIYSGPDKAYQGHEICFNYNEDTLTVVDVTDKDHMEMLSRVGYEGAKYTHQVRCSTLSCIIVIA